MKIIDKIHDIHIKIYTDPFGAGGALAKTLQDEAFAAALKGWKTDEWRTYMCHFASNTNQLERLCGNDATFNEITWGPKSLAYMVANSTCGITTTTGTRNNLTSDMIRDLDNGIDPTPGATGCPPE
jgi:hypothetical protein